MDPPHSVHCKPNTLTNSTKSTPRSELDANSVYSQETPLNKLYLMTFRKDKCATECTLPGCFSYHAAQRPRRVPLPDHSQHGWNYLPALCKHSKTCKFADNCYFAHSREEQNFHPLRFRVKFCKFAGSSNCAQGAHCPFAHNAGELRSSGVQGKREFSLSTYKTAMCAVPGCIDSTCLDYHSRADKRRVLGQHQYSHRKCPNMFTAEEFDCDSICPSFDDCGFAHNFYEVNFHPAVYCKSPAEDGSCTRCHSAQVAWVYECGVPVCSACLGQACPNCGVQHLARVLS